MSCRCLSMFTVFRYCLLVAHSSWWLGGSCVALRLVVVVRSAVGAQLCGVWGGRAAGGMGVVGVMCKGLVLVWGGHYDP